MLRGSVCMTLSCTWLKSCLASRVSAGCSANRYEAFSFQNPCEVGAGTLCAFSNLLGSERGSPPSVLDQILVSCHKGPRVKKKAQK